VSGAKGKKLKATIVNLGAANAGGDDQDFAGYKARFSYDRKKWLLVCRT
jgi:hypothetical protein